MSNSESRPIATSIRVDHEHTLEMRADMATKTAEVENVTTGEMYSGGGGGDSDFSTAEVTINITINGTGDSNNYVSLAGLIDVVDNEYLDTAPYAFENDDTVTCEAVLYKNQCGFSVDGIGQAVISNISTTGNATVNDNIVIATGDCVINITATINTPT